MHEELVIGGFGGQGVLFIGRLLAEAAFREGHEVVFMPSYGAEKRGGTVWCHVTISDEEIGSLFITSPTMAIAMNAASLTKLEPMMKPEGLLVVNQSLAPQEIRREDIHAIYVPASDLAAGLGDSSVSNLVALGALLASRPVVAPDSLTAVLEGMLAKNKELLELNKRALALGYTQIAKDAVPQGRR